MRRIPHVYGWWSLITTHPHNPRQFASTTTAVTQAFRAHLLQNTIGICPHQLPTLSPDNLATILATRMHDSMSSTRDVLRMLRALTVLQGRAWSPYTPVLMDAALGYVCELVIS